MLVIDNIQVYYDTAHILNGTSLEVGNGEVVGLLGRNGMGKTTLVRTIAGIDPPQQAGGTITWQGDPDFPEGAWVVALHFSDRGLWQAVKSGEKAGVSFEAIVEKVPAVVNVTEQRQVVGKTDTPGADHEHEFSLTLDGAGNVIRGATGIANGHRHAIKENMRTGVADDHRHLFLVERPIRAAA